MGNTSLTHRNTTLLAVEATPGQVTVSSDDIDEMLAPARKRLRIPKGILQRVAGVYERRWWKDEEDGWKQGIVHAAERAMAKSGVSRDQIGLLINASVSRPYLEPALSTTIHSALGLPTSTLNFDVTNACLGFVNAMTMAATMIDSGAVEYVMVVGAENIEQTQRATIERLNSKTATRADYNSRFASLTLGCGAAVAILGPADKHPEGHRLLHTEARAGTEHHELCIGSMEDMRTDTQGLLENGLALVLDAWREAHDNGRNFKNADYFIIHQVSMPYARSFAKTVGVDFERIPVTFPDYGNVAAEAVPITLAHYQDTFKRGERIVLLGVGSGLNTAMTEVEW